MPDKKTRSLEAALTIAIEDFSSRPYEVVSIADIAKRAACSTTTLYDAYTNKRGLFYAALLRAPGNAGYLSFAANFPGEPLHQLFLIAIADGDHMNHPQTRMRFRKMMAQLDEFNEAELTTLRDRFESAWRMVHDTIKNAKAVGDIGAQHDASALTDMMFAMYSYLGVMIPLTVRSTAVIKDRDPARIASGVFSNFCTVQGRKKMKRYVKEMQETEQPGSGD
jgi:AcrR family transcriptional regulator